MCAQLRFHLTTDYICYSPANLSHSKVHSIATFFIQTVPTAPPGNLTVVVLDSRSLQLSWNSPPDEHQNGEVLGYSISIAAVRTGTKLQYNSTSISLIVSDLDPYSTYHCRVAAFTIAGTGPFTPVVEQTTEQDGMFQVLP